MGTTLHTLTPNPGANRGKKRVGRGHGSGLHKTSGKGQKGQKARTGHHGIPKPGFEGGQTMLARRLPKRGFNNKRFQAEIVTVNLGTIAERFSAGETVDPSSLKARGLIPRSSELVKILADGNLGHSLTIRAHYFSAAAREKLDAVQGTIEQLVVQQPFQAEKPSKSARKS